jgi:hypothetical protein
MPVYARSMPAVCPRVDEIENFTFISQSIDCYLVPSVTLRNRNEAVTNAPSCLRQEVLARFCDEMTYCRYVVPDDVSNIVSTPLSADEERESP